MTVTQRRNRPAAVPVDDEQSQRSALEPGIKVTCDFCHIDITNTVRFKCAHDDCRDLDICPSCFTEGKEGRAHKATHSYMVEEPLTTPIFHPDWGADEEILLISGLILFGLGNWLEVAGHIGTRSKEECERHYCETYLGCTVDGDSVPSTQEEESDEDKKRKRQFMPPMATHIDVDPEEWQVRKRQRLEEMRKPQALPPPAGPLVSAPTNHEVGGFMPGRLEFETEVDNEAEMAVKDMDFGLVWKYGGDEQPEAKPTVPAEQEEESDGDEDGEDDEASVKDEKPDVDVKPARASSSPRNTKKKGKVKAKAKEEEKEPVVEIEDEDELEVKLALLDIYFTRLDKREEAKEIIFDRGLTEYKKILAADRKRLKEERELIHRYKVFAKLQTAKDFEVLCEGLNFEQVLRRRITELQEYRRMGITTASEAEVYDAAKATRAGYRPVLPRDRPEPPLLTGARVNAGQHRNLHGVPGTPPPIKPTWDTSRPSQVRKPAAPLNLANSAGLDLLSNDERTLCSQLRVLPKPYLSIKELYVREHERRMGGLKRRDARRLLKIDVNKSGRIYDFLVNTGVLRLTYDPEAGDKQAQAQADAHVHNQGQGGHLQPPHKVQVANVHLGPGQNGHAHAHGVGNGVASVPPPLQSLVGNKMNGS